jgi:prefoldin subunit 5
MANTDLQLAHRILTREIAALEAQQKSIADELASKREALEHLKDHADPAPSKKPEGK